MPFRIENGVLKRYIAEPGVTAVTVPDSVTGIGMQAFQGCKNLTAIIIPDSVTNIGSFAFYDCTSLAEIHIPDGVPCIAQNTFWKCASLKKMYLPDSVTAIGDDAFQDCTSLAEIRIPERVTSIGYDAFQGCQALSVIRLHEDEPAPRRNYAAFSSLGYYLGQVLEILRNGDYDAKVRDIMKYLFLPQHWFHTHDAKLTAYIREHLDEFMRELIPAGDICVIAAFAQTDAFFTAENIDRYINLAQEKRQNEIFMILLNYKNMHFGFTETKNLRL